jgi:hypothetical protein
LQFVKPYFSPADIDKGARWNNEISKELEQSKIGIIAMTEENLTSPWIMFETGAISKVVEEGQVCPILFDIRKTDLVGPLASFQAIDFNKDEVRQLLTTINKAAKEAALPERNLDEAFDKWWPDLEKRVKAIPTAQAPSRPKRTTDDLLRENLELTRSLVTEHQKLTQALTQGGTTILTQGGLTDVHAVIRALRRRDAKLQALEPQDKAAMEAYEAGLAAGLTAKSE